jgi:Flp pilus assembly protein TadG
MKSKARFGIDRERGSTILEFGLVSIAFLALFFGIVDFGRALYTYHFVANAAREATRWASVRGSACQTTDGCPPGGGGALPADIAAYLGTITPSGISANNYTFIACWPGMGSDASNFCPTPVSPTNGCTANTTGPNNNNPGCPVKVQITYGFSFIFPLMPSSICSSIQNGQTRTTVTANICMTSTSQMVISQ